MPLANMGMGFAFKFRKSDSSVQDYLRLVTTEQLQAQVTPRQASPFFCGQISSACSVPTPVYLIWNVHSITAFYLCMGRSFLCAFPPDA